MPLHWTSLSRRSFLVSGSALIGMTVFRPVFGADAEVDPDLFILMSDTHIPGSPDFNSKGVNMTANLKQVVAEIGRMPKRPGGVIINGDCAFVLGLPEDYANLADCLEPIEEVGIPLHVTIGNHDDRGPLYEAFQAQKPAQPVVDSKHISIIETERANWFLLDSMIQVRTKNGEFGEKQLEWLAQALDERRDKPAIILAHHYPMFEPGEENGGFPDFRSGLLDTSKFLEILTSRPQVKAYIFGHSHVWSVNRIKGLHLVNLPTTAYSRHGSPNGWVRARQTEEGLSLELRTMDPNHQLNGERHLISWT